MIRPIFLMIFASLPVIASPCPSGKFALVIHGGAGKWDLPPEIWEKYKVRLTRMLEDGYTDLREGGSSLDAVQKIVEKIEDSGLLNAGKGAVRTSEGVVELDASIMDGQTQKAGAVASVKTLKNPIRAARQVMEKTKHVLLVSSGAESFGAKNGVEVVDAEYFKEVVPDARGRSKLGTVGAVALDCHGNLAAATSTGGLEGKMPGRVGDSPIIGAGTYANNNTCAVSATGKGEYFIRTSAARDVAALVEYQQESLQKAADTVLRKIATLGGEGGVISINKTGDIALSFNTQGMLRGIIREDGKPWLSLLPAE